MLKNIHGEPEAPSSQTFLLVDSDSDVRLGQVGIPWPAKFDNHRLLPSAVAKQEWYSYTMKVGWCLGWFDCSVLLSEGGKDANICSN